MFTTGRGQHPIGALDDPWTPVMSDRRYSDAEVAVIFSKAAEGAIAPAAGPPQEEGLTLADLQAIGRDVGLSPDSIALAARSLALGGRSNTRTLLGFPIRVERVVPLGRKLSEAEWEHLVVELREVFEARGKVSASGSLRQWTNGNLQALLEPTPAGDRIRLRTTHGQSRTQLRLGVAALVLTAAEIAMFAATGQLAHNALAVASAGAMGVLLFAVGAFRLPSWARRRREQMEAVASRLAGQDGE
jgi:hypothetical protein